MGILFLAVSIKLEVFQIKEKLPFLKELGLFEGTYTKFSSQWYLKYGTMIVQTMILEIPIPHLFPLVLLIAIGSMRCIDRQCTCNRRKSKKLLQRDYENLYEGPEFTMDSRLAQIVAYFQVTFMYSHTLPLLFPIAAVNFAFMYWVDKWLVLRFYRTPKNYDEGTVLRMLYYMKFAFLCHFLMGLLMLSNGAILSGESTQNQIPTIIEANKWSRSKLGFNVLSDEFQSVHLLAFIAANCFLLSAIFFEVAFLKLGLRYCNCLCGICKKFRMHLDSLKALSDDYYDEISLKFLLDEHQRTKIESEKI